MSKAFTSEETDEAPIVIRPRAPLPDGVPNYVTPAGLAALEAELKALRTHSVKDPAIAGRVADLEARIATAVKVEPAPHPDVRFGTTVELEDERGGKRRYQLVGVDEADAKAGKIAFTAPLARAVLGKKAGETFSFHTPRGDEELTVTSIA